MQSLLTPPSAFSAALRPTCESPTLFASARGFFRCNLLHFQAIRYRPLGWASVSRCSTPTTFVLVPPDLVAMFLGVRFDSAYMTFPDNEPVFAEN